MAQDAKLITGTPKAVAAAGTAERLSATDLMVHTVTLYADPDNTGNVYIGGPTVDDQSPIALAPEDQLILTGKGHSLFNLKDVWIDADTNANAVGMTYSAGIEAKIIKA